MMSRYIDAELLKVEFAEDFTQAYATTLIKRIIDRQPTVDMREVKYGHWIPSDETDVWQCSECWHYTNERIFKEHRDINGNICYKSVNPFYCSCCGAKMDLEEDIE